MNNDQSRGRTFFKWGLKIALSSALLSAVADRFGFWGEVGAGGVVWGNFASFTAYTGILAPWAQGVFLDILSWFVTALEVLLGILLLTNFRQREVAFISGSLL